MACSPITSWQIDGEKVEAVVDFIFLGSKITADGTWVNGGCTPPNIPGFQGFSASLPWSPVHLSLNFGSAPAVCPQDGSHNSPTQS